MQDNGVNKRHQEMVTALAKPGEEIVKEMTPEKAHLLHMAIGISGEAGELLDQIKKHTMYNKPLDIKNVDEELGDLEFYIEGLRQGVALLRENILQNNIDKLYTRYSKGSFSNEQAQQRADKK